MIQFIRITEQNEVTDGTNTAVNQSILKPWSLKQIQQLVTMKLIRF